MKQLFWIVCALGATAALAAPGGKGSSDVRTFKPSKVGASCYVDFKLADLNTSFTFKVRGNKAREVYSFRTGFGEQKLPKFYVSYSEMAQRRRADPSFAVPYTVFKGQSLRLTGAIDIEWFSFPRFYYYDFGYAKSQVGRWEKEFPYAYEEDFHLEVRYEPLTDDLWFFLNGQYVARWEGSGSLRSIAVAGVMPVVKSLDQDDDDLENMTLEESGPQVNFTEFTYEPTSEYCLQNLAKCHTHPLLRKGAKLSLKPGRHKFDECTMEIWNPEHSLDQGLHRKLNSAGDLFDDAYFNRNGLASGVAEYMDFCVPSAFYSHAWVLFADLPQSGKTPALGIMMTRWTNLGAASIANGGVFGLEDPKKAGCRQVGELTYEEDGKTKTVPLWLGKATWDAGKIFDLMEDAPIHGLKDKKTGKRGCLARSLKNLRYLDFDLCGTGGYSHERSSIQVFGCSLVRAPWQIQLSQSESGNIFADDEPLETGFTMTADRDGEKGTIEYDIFDAYFKPVDSRKVEFICPKAGEGVRVALDLKVAKVGWYGLKIRFKDAAGNVRFSHRAAFANLGPDTREAGFESPYAAWPQLLEPTDPKDEKGLDPVKTSDEADYVVLGRHNTNPDRRTVFKMMHKAGFHKSWGAYAIDENEFPDYKWTMSMFPIGNPPNPGATQAETEQQWEDAMEKLRRWHKRFPHCNMVMFLHETGGKGLAAEVCGKSAVQGAYKGASGPWDVYWLTEFVKRMKKEFPHFVSQIGNGSSSSEKVAELARNGLDLKLFEYMGIESKGFSTMPELNANLEAPGMGWALRETARQFGHKDAKVTCCGEYVFRPEREVSPDSDYMRRTNYVLRDYLVSLCFGALNISHGHIEDCRSNYYNTNWGAGGQCEVYPYSYPKRGYVAIAALTKALDKPKYLGSVADGALTVYTEEFLRERKVPDYAYALWTPERPAQVAFTFPKGTKVEVVNTFGDAFEPKAGADGKILVDVGPSPRYLIASKRCEKAEARTASPLPPEGCKDKVLFRPAFENCCPVKDYSKGDYWPKQGAFDLVNGEDPVLGQVMECRLVKTMTKVPEIVTEYGTVKPNDLIVFKAPGKGEAVGVWYRANGTWGTSSATISFTDEKGNRRVEERGHVYQFFDGWTFMELARDGNAGDQEMAIESFRIETARRALNPQEMEDVTVHPVFGPVVLRTGKPVRAEKVRKPDEPDPRFSADWQNLDINLRHR